jgi:hypothetical protein
MSIFRASLEEDVSCFRRRVAAVFQLEEVYAKRCDDEVQNVIKLVYKGVLSDGVKLGDTKVKSNATVSVTFAQRAQLILDMNGIHFSLRVVLLLTLSHSHS